MTAPLPLVLPLDNASPEPTAAEQRVWPLPAPERTAEERAEIERRRLVLAIESSCDETAVAIIDADGNILANQCRHRLIFMLALAAWCPRSPRASTLRSS